MSDIQFVSLNEIVFNRFQQSDAKNEAKILEIASSINQHRDNGTKGLLQVPTARLLEDGKYELAFGHHRFMAFQIAAAADVFFNEMPLIVRELSDLEMFELMAIENFHRRDISPIEEAKTFHSYMETFGKTSVETAQKFEKTDEYVRASIRLLNLPETAQQMVTDGRLTKTTARDLLVLEKLGGSHLVDMGIDEIEGDNFENPTNALKIYLNNSPFTKHLDDSADWFKAGKNFPRKHLTPLTTKDLDEIVHYADGSDEGVTPLLLKEIMTLIASGMEVTNEAFPDINPDDLLRVRILANPTACEKCPLHAVLDGDHYCGLPLCQERKKEAWNKKKLEDIASKVGVPMYRKEDGGYLGLSPYDDKDKKLWADGSPDLRLKEAKYQYNNFDGLNTTDLAVVVVGETFEKRKAAADKKNAKADATATSEREARDLIEKQRQLKITTILQFSWVTASPEFASMLDGITSLEVLKFMFDEINQHPDFPEGMDPDEVLKDLDSMKRADALKHMRRVLAYAMLEMYLIRNDLELSEDEKKIVMKHAKTLAQIADTWEVKLPKNFMAEAEAYQAELDAALKELEPQKAKK